MLTNANYDASKAFKFGTSFNGCIAFTKQRFAEELYVAIEEELRREKIMAEERFKPLLQNLYRNLQYCKTKGKNGERYYTIFGAVHAHDYEYLKYLIVRAKSSVAYKHARALDDQAMQLHQSMS